MYIQTHTHTTPICPSQLDPISTLLEHIILSSDNWLLTLQLILLSCCNEAAPKEHKEVALWMSLKNVSDKKIYCYTEISEWLLQYLQKTYQETGEVVRVPVCPGQPCTLDSLDANVSCILYLDSPIYKLFVSFLRSALNNNWIFYLRNCKINWWIPCCLPFPHYWAPNNATE